MASIPHLTGGSRILLPRRKRPSAAWIPEEFYATVAELTRRKSAILVLDTSGSALRIGARTRRPPGET